MISKSLSSSEQKNSPKFRTGEKRDRIARNSVALIIKEEGKSLIH